MKQRHLLQPQQNKAIEDKYSDNPLFHLLRFICTPIQAEASTFAILPGELFYNCLYCIDTLKGKNYTELKQECPLIWFHNVNYLKDKSLSIEDKDVFMGAALLTYSVSRALRLSRLSTYTYSAELISVSLMEQNPNVLSTLRKRFNLAIKRIGERQLNQWMSTYLKEPMLLSDEIEQVIDENAVAEEADSGQKTVRKRKKPVVNTSFMTFQLNGIMEAHIAMLCQRLIAFKWISKDTPPDDFQKLFSGKVCVCKIPWIGGGIDNLYELFKQIKDQELITIPGDYGLDAVLSNHFVDKNGDPLLVKYNGRPAKKGLPKISECIKILQTQYEGFN